MSEAKNGEDLRAYCTAANVRTIIQTNLTDSEITGIIEISDTEIDKRLGTQDASDSRSDK